jgi:hypothetical protein
MFTQEQAKSLRLQFWEKLNNRTRRLPGQKGKKKIWLFDNTGIKGLDLRFDVARKKYQVALEINHNNEGQRLFLFEKLLACKPIFEKEFGEALIWNFFYKKDTGEQVCRIFVEKPGDILKNELWTQLIYFLINTMINLEKAFLSVKEYLQYDINK